MWKLGWAFIRDMVQDGYAVIGILAAPLSIAFTLAKAFDVQALGHLGEISYAWALAPLTLWFFVAYVRRRAASIASADLGDPSPDWTLKELFEYIRPDDLLDNENWKIVGLDVLDRLSTGQITAWGRALPDSQVSSLDAPRPLQPINQTFWANAGFTYGFLAGDRNMAHAYDRQILNHGPSYCDIQVSKAYALRIWMKK